MMTVAGFSSFYEENPLRRLGSRGGHCGSGATVHLPVWQDRQKVGAAFPERRRLEGRHADGEEEREPHRAAVDVRPGFVAEALVR